MRPAVRESSTSGPLKIDQASAITAPLPPNSDFRRAQTCFFKKIDLMRQHLEGDSRGLPKTLAELNARVKAVQGKKTHLWIDLAAQFKENFNSDKVARKWGALEEEYKKIKDSSRSTGQSRIHFPFFIEMGSLLGDKHDINYPVVGTAKSVEVRRPDAVGLHGQDLATKEADSPMPTPQPRQMTPHRWRGRAEDGPLLEFLRESEADS